MNGRNTPDFMLTRRFSMWESRSREEIPEVLVPVPLHPARQRKRGYNQAEVFAEKLAEEMELPMNARLIRRVKKTKRQKELGPAERRKNLEGAFALAKPGQMKYCRILLVDDIYTTGSTVDAIASLLKVNGAEQVDFVCAAICKIVCEYFENSFPISETYGKINII